MKGIYVILIEFDRSEVVLLGKKHNFYLRQGFYSYVGSALGGLESRVERHLSPIKKIHWHIDYLLAISKIVKIICTETGERKECMAAKMLAQRFTGIAGFGCSDCKCQSHLFYCQDLTSLEAAVLDVMKILKLEPFVYV